MKKKYLFYAMMSAIALAGTLGLTACSSDDEVAAVENNPNYDAATGLVKSQFVLNIAPAGQGEQTKMTADMVQQNNNFRGIHSVHIYTYATGTASGTPYVLNSDGWTDANAKDFPLGTLYATGQIDNAPGQNAGAKSGY